MTLTTQTPPKTPVLIPEEVGHPVNPASGHRENPSPEHSLLPAHQEEHSRKSVLYYLGWTVILVGVGVAWYKHEIWFPTVAPYIGLGSKPAAKPPARVIPVVTTVVQKKDMDVFINGLGTVTAFKTVTVRSRVEGELVKVAFTEGQMVKEGDVLAEIDRRPFEKTLQQYEGTLEKDEATLKMADLTLKRYEELLLRGSIEAQKVDEQRGLVKQTAGAIQADRALVGNAKLQLEFCHIVSPISGRIGLRLVDQGNMVRANDVTGLAVITQMQPIALVFPIVQDEISRVQKALNEGRELVVMAFDRSLKTKLATGKLASLDNQVDLTTGTVRAKAVFENEDGMLFPNQFVNARLLVDTTKDAIVVPSAAVQRGPNFFYVYVVQPDETVDLRTVKTGMEEGSEMAILSGLEPGEIVVTEGLDKLQKGAQVSTGSKEKNKEGKPSDGKEKSEKKNGDSRNPNKNPADSNSNEKPAATAQSGDKD